MQRPLIILIPAILIAGCTAPTGTWTFAGNQTPASTPVRLSSSAPPVTVAAGGNVVRPVLEMVRTPRHDYVNRGWPENVETLRMAAGERLVARTTGTVARLELRLMRETEEAQVARSQSTTGAEQVVMRSIDPGAYTGFVVVQPERITYRYRVRLRVR